MVKHQPYKNFESIRNLRISFSYFSCPFKDCSRIYKEEFVQERTSEHPVMLNYFPYGKYSRPRTAQVQGFVHIEDSNHSATVEAPTGTGKTVLGYTFL